MIDLERSGYEMAHEMLDKAFNGEANKEIALNIRLADYLDERIDQGWLSNDIETVHFADLIKRDTLAKIDELKRERIPLNRLDTPAETRYPVKVECKNFPYFRNSRRVFGPDS